MKTILAALPLLVVTSAASAQSSLILFGVVDVNYQWAHQDSAHMSRLVGSGSNAPSRLGFRATEDLGDGLSAGFWLEAAVNVDTGTGGATSLNNQTTAPGTGSAGLVFNRRSTVSLTSASWGELRLGRDYVPSFWNLTIFDPFGTVGAGAAANLAYGSLTQTNSAVFATALRASNSIGYLTPGCAYPVGCSGFYGQAMYALGENASNTPNHHDGNYAGLRAGYALGQFNVALGTGTTRMASGDVRQSNIGASYDSGVVRLTAEVFGDHKGGTVPPGAANGSRGWLLGAKIIAGVGEIPLSLGSVRDNSDAHRKATQLAAGYVHYLSKRTVLYSTFSTIRNRNGAALSGGGVPGVADTRWSGFDLGMRHTF